MKISSNLDPLTEEHGNSIVGALWLAPDIAQNIGIYLASVSYYEYILLVLYRYACGVGGDFLFATFGNIISISTRLEIIEDTLQARKSAFSDEEFKSALETLKTAKEINTRRNELVHGLYRVYEKTRLVVLTTWPHSTARKSKGEVITVKKLQDDTLKVATFTGQVVKLFDVEGQPLEEHLRWP